jgi:hypothetical protein
MKYKKLILNKIQNLKYLSIFIFAILICLPNTTFAATIKVSSESSVYAKDVSILNVFIDTEDEVINSLDGYVILSDNNKGNFEIKDLSLVNSVFNLWPRKPSLQESNKIYFVGGLPGGIKGNNLLLFKIIVKINEPGNFSISPENLKAYLNDGLATSRSIVKNVSTISISESRNSPQDKWKEIISNDNTAPENFEIKVIQDDNLFDGKKFLSFETTDKESGINYYEVKEGDAKAVRTGNTYILIDQKNKPDVIVTAYDKAGNFQVATLNGKDPIHWRSIIITLIILTVLYKIIKRIRKNRKNAKV